MTTLSPVFQPEEMLKIVSEFKRISDRCYLENAGAMLYPQILLHKINEDLTNNIYMNPHSDKFTRDCIEQIRCLILNHFNTDSSKYTVVFTSGSTQALKLVVESFQFACKYCDESDQNCGSFVYLQDNHTSVLGLRELAKDKNADIIHISHEDFLKYGDDTRPVTPVSPNLKRSEKDGNSLFVYPAQSNFNGFKYPLHITEYVKEGCLNNYVRRNLSKVNCNWYILLDAASYVATSKLDLSKTSPDFVCLSFYKIFGYPTGLGALLIKNASASALNQKRYFGGGTVDIVLSSEDFHIKRSDLHERLEDGTSNFLGILSLKHCFDTMHKMIPKTINGDLMETISCHTFFLAKDLYHQLKSLSHPNGTKAVTLYSDSDFDDIKRQGGIVTFNLMRDDGSYIGYAEFQHMADLFNINVRTGCFCNSGSCQRHLKATNKEMKDMYKAGHKCGDEFDLINGKPTGAIRASFAYYNTFHDVDKLIIMICRCFVKTILRRPMRSVAKLKFQTNIPSGLTTSLISRFYNNEIFNDGIEFNNDYLREMPVCKIVLKEIAVFPVKSCGAFKTNSWRIGAKGFEYDREWMIVNYNGVCLTQKNNTRMCLIKPMIDLQQRVLILNFKGKTPISVPLDLKASDFKKASLCSSKVCADTVNGLDCGDEVANWISEALDVSHLRLFRQSHEGGRQKRNTKSHGNILSLSNQAQYLLINKATVRWLSDKIQDPDFTDTIDKLTDRFRGNLIIDMDEELVERDWQKLLIGEHIFRVEGQCNRCQMVCIDQQTGVKTVEPLRTISEQFGGKMKFGIYLTHVGSLNGSKSNILELQSSVTPIEESSVAT